MIVVGSLKVAGPSKNQHLNDAIALAWNPTY